MHCRVEKVSQCCGDGCKVSAWLIWLISIQYYFTNHTPDSITFCFHFRLSFKDHYLQIRLITATHLVVIDEERTCLHAMNHSRNIMFSSHWSWIYYSIVWNYVIATLVLVQHFLSSSHYVPLKLQNYYCISIKTILFEHNCLYQIFE